MKVLVKQSCPTLCDPVDGSLLGSSVPGILQSGILEWVAISLSRGSSWPGTKPGSPALQADSLLSEPPGKPRYSKKIYIYVTSLCTRKSKNVCSSLYCIIHFVEGVWNTTHSICKVSLSLYWNFSNIEMLATSRKIHSLLSRSWRHTPTAKDLTTFPFHFTLPAVQAHLHSSWNNPCSYCVAPYIST